jgi:hypothetical protein
MDAEMMDAVAVVDIDPSQSVEWFGLVDEAYSTSNGDWDVFSERLNSTAGGSFGAAAESFLGYVADHGKIDLIGRLVAELPNLPSVYAGSREQAAQPQADGSPWDVVVQQFGSGWAAWDGSEVGWVQFRDWTYTSANEQDPDLYAAAFSQLDPLNDSPLPERIATLTMLGFTISAQPEPPQSAVSLWENVVRQFGPGWAEWDGSEDGWVQFRDWTYSSANAQDPDMYGAAYTTLDTLNVMPLAERIARLTELGFAVHVSAEQSAAAEQPAAAATAAESPSTDPIIEEAVAEAMREIPGSEALTAEELARMRAEIAEELASETAQ